MNSPRVEGRRRQLFWAMGMSTRLDVALRAAERPPESGRRSSGPETFTDLDVLGLSVGPGFRVQAEIADCKTSQRESTSRMLWVRGTADLFGAAHAYLVREHEVSDAARQLSAKLGITVLATKDLSLTQDQYDAHWLNAPDSGLQVLFDREAVAASLAAFNDLDRT